MWDTKSLSTYCCSIKINFLTANLLEGFSYQYFVKNPTDTMSREIIGEMRNLQMARGGSKPLPTHPWEFIILGQSLVDKSNFESMLISLNFWTYDLVQILKGKIKGMWTKISYSIQHSYPKVFDYGKLGIFNFNRTRWTWYQTKPQIWNKVKQQNEYINTLTVTWPRYPAVPLSTKVILAARHILFTWFRAALLSSAFITKLNLW